MTNNLTHFDPFREITRLDPFRNIEDFLRDFRLGPTMRGYESQPRIRMDVTEDDQSYVVKAEIPGVRKEDIKIDIEGNQVSISAEVKQEKEQMQGGNLVNRERYYGQQYRSFTLPREIDDTKAQAKYQDGVLELSLPKKAGHSGRQVSIQ